MTITATPILQLDHLYVHYPERRLIHDLSAGLGVGVTIVQGGDGCGKTTLLRQIAGEAAPSEASTGGTLTLDGVRLDQQPQAYRAQVWYIEPRTAAFDQLSVPAFFTQMQQRYPGFDAAALPALIEGLALTPHLEKQLFMLSTGSKRKVYLAAAFAAGARLTLLDDPFAALDQASINFVCHTLNTLTASAQASRIWLASFYEIPAAIKAVGLIDLGD